MSWRWISWLLPGLLASLMAGCNRGAQTWAPIHSVSVGGHLVEASIMRLGFPADRWAAVEVPKEGAKKAERCRRWRAVAEQLSETFAGHTLRKTIVRRHCAMFDDGTASTWEWPWSGLERGRVLPPRLHRAFGPWAIRCGAGAQRLRCAIVHQAGHAVADPDMAGADPPGPISTHFVIDRVAGREVLLWRLFVPQTAAMAVVADDATDGGTRSWRANLATTADSGVRWRIRDRHDIERFPACAASGCLMEMTAERAGEVATALADGKPLVIEIVRGSTPPQPFALPARGFSEALVELMRLRRAELRSGAMQ